VKITDLGKSIGKSNTDTKQILQALNIPFQGEHIDDSLAEQVINKVNEAKESVALPPQQKPEAKQEKSQPAGLEQTIAASGMQSTQAINNLFDSVENDAESLAHLASAKFVSKFAKTMAQDQVDFTSLYVRGIAHRLTEIQNQVNSQIQATENFIQDLPQITPVGAIASLLPSVK
jgi:hypothetical protein